MEQKGLSVRLGQFGPSAVSDWLFSNQTSADSTVDVLPVSLLSELSPDWVCIDSVRCLEPVRVLSLSILSTVRIPSGFSEKCCPLSVRPEKDETEMSDFLVSLFADV